MLHRVVAGGVGMARPGLGATLLVVVLMASTSGCMGLIAAREAVEDIENRIATKQEIKQWMEEGKIRDGKTLIGLYSLLSSARFGQD